MKIKAEIKLHNRFDIEVKDIKSGEIVQRAMAENIILNQMYEELCKVQSYVDEVINKKIYYGKGSGTLSASRTTLFSQLGSMNSLLVDSQQNSPPLASYSKKKIVILPASHVGETLTEVGVGSSKLLTHALIKDAEGNTISIGPKTDTQEITIYATLFASVTLPDGVLLTFDDSNKNVLLNRLLGVNGYTALCATEGATDRGIHLKLSTNKLPTDQTDAIQDNGVITTVPSRFIVVNTSLKTIKTNRIRFESVTGNGKIWSISMTGANAIDENKSGFIRMLFPNTLWPGHHFEGGNLGSGDGIKTKFILPWSDINTSKEYKFYVDGALKIASTDYTLANSESETSITFATAPATGKTVTGDWWVDYIPKDNEHVLDITFTITFSEGV